MPRKLLLGIACLCLLVPGLRGDVPVQKQSFNSGGVRIHYVVDGKQNGDPVVLIHGFTASIDMWAPVFKGLVKDYRVIALDCRGHGDSEKPHDPKQYGFEMVRDVVRLLDHLKIDKAHVVGYSMGARIALQVAASYPERVRTLTVGGAGLPEPGRNKLLSDVADSLEQGKGLGPLIVALTPAGRPRPTEQQLKNIDAMLLARNDSKALAAVLRGAEEKNTALSDEQVRKMAMPVLGLIGSVDPLRPGVDDLKKRLAKMTVIVIDKADHITAFSRPEFVNGLKEFLGRHRTVKGE